MSRAGVLQASKEFRDAFLEVARCGWSPPADDKSDQPPAAARPGRPPIPLTASPKTVEYTMLKGANSGDPPATTDPAQIKDQSAAAATNSAANVVSL